MSYVPFGRRCQRRHQTLRRDRAFRPSPVKGRERLSRVQPFQALPRLAVTPSKPRASNSLPPFPRDGFASHPSPRPQPYRGSMKALTPARLTPPDRPLRLLRLDFPAFRPQPRGLPGGRFLSRLSAIGCFQASPRKSRLATVPRRIRFVLLRTAGSPPVALHPASRRRSYLQLRSLRPAPARTCTVQTKRPHGRTLSRESRNPGISVVYPLFMPGASSGPPLARGRRIWVGTRLDYSLGRPGEAVRQ